MSSTTTHRGVGERMDDVQEVVSSRVAEFAAAWARRVAVHAMHVAVFVTLVVNRDHTVLAFLGWLTRVFGTAAAGMPAGIVSIWSQSFAGFWSFVAPVIGL